VTETLEQISDLFLVRKPRMIRSNGDLHDTTGWRSSQHLAIAGTPCLVFIPRTIRNSVGRPERNSRCCW
jgi:hypothetical protein